MEKDIEKSIATFSIKIVGENEINAYILSKIINDITELTELAAEEESQAIIKLNIKAFENGSFKIDFSTICEVSNNLFNPFNQVINLASKIVEIVNGVFKIKKFFSDRKIKNIIEDSDKAILENENGNRITVPKSSCIIIKNQRVDNLVIDMLGNIKEHNPQASFEFISASGTSLFTAADIEDMIKGFQYNKKICQIQQVETELIIKKADIIGSSAWEFYYKNSRILANISDDDWLEKLHNREFKIGYGDSIIVLLEIRIDLNAESKPIEGTERYAVTKIKGDIKTASTQISFL